MLNSVALSTRSSFGMTADAESTARDGAPKGEDGGLPLSEFLRYFQEVQNQPTWRSVADKEMDYVDGNQLSAEILQKMRSLGIPPAIEPMIGPAVDAVMGYEAKTRKDWRITADGEGKEGEDVAAALNYKINQAERHSGADRACGEAFRTQYCVGIGWVEVAKESDPFLFKYRCSTIHRNEIWWDWLSKRPDLSDARYLLRRKWTDVEQAALKWPDKADIIRTCGLTAGWAEQVGITLDGGTTPALANAWQAERGWSVEEQEWRDSVNRRVCIFECWYRRWEQVTILKSPDGRVVEFDRTNPSHVIAVAQGLIKPEKIVKSRMYVSFWMGPHKLSDGPSPYPHPHFPYVPFWGKREDRTAIPYGAVRGMVFLQDNINASTSKIRWGLAAVRTERTKGAVMMTDEKFRQQAGRVDADIILDPEAMAKTGARFEVKRDFQLSDQQYKMLMDARAGIERVSGITPSFKGQTSTARSGVQEDTQVEQTTQALADLMENFEAGRSMVGELLLAMEIADLGNRREEVTIKGAPPKKDKVVVLNDPATDHTGVRYCTNDIQRTRLKVSLADVPSTTSFRKQQLQAMTEAFKAMPQNLQVVCLPHLMSLMDVPNKDAIIEAIQQSSQSMTEEQVQQRIDQALKDAGHDLKARELELKYNPEKIAKELELLDANIANLDAKARQTVAMIVKAYIDSQFAAMQAAEVVTAVPQVTPVADVLMANAGGLPGHQPVPVPAGGPGAQIVDKVVNKRTGIGFHPGAVGAGPAAGDTSPLTPAQPASPFVGANHGTETMRSDTVGPMQ